MHRENKTQKYPKVGTLMYLLRILKMIALIHSKSVSSESTRPIKSHVASR